MDTLIVVALWGLGVWGLYHLFMGRAKSRLARDRMLAVEAGEEERAGEERPEPWLEGWLTRAGIRAPGSASAFALAAGLCLVLGLGLALTLALTPALDPLREGAAGLGEGSAGLLAALVDLVPWALFVGLAAAPWLHVRRKREQRVEDIERELPVVLEGLDLHSRRQPLSWLETDAEKREGKMLSLPTRQDIPVLINEQMIVELYSK